MNHATAEKGRSRAGHLSLWVALAVLAGFGFARNTNGAVESGPAPAAPSNEITVALKEVPVWEIASERVRGSFTRGQYAIVQQAASRPGKCPKFISETPLYGQVSFQDVSADSRESRNCSFALDSTLKGGDYDLLYFDDNGDGDLTNDKPHNPLPQSDRLIRRSSSLQEVYFEPVQVTFPLGPAGAQPLELLPHLLRYQGDSSQFSFVAARVHTGTFTIDGTTYQAFIGYQYTVGAPLDQPATTFVLAPQGGEPVYWWGGDELCAAHRLGGRFYRFSCTPTGDKLSVRPHTGPVGTLEVGAGGRKVEKVQMSGSLRSKEMAVAVGDVAENGWPGPTQRCEIPAGDYYPAIMTVILDNIEATVSNNYHVNAQGESRRSEGRRRYHDPPGQALRAGFLQQAGGSVHGARRRGKGYPRKRGYGQGGPDRSEAGYHGPPPQ